MRIWPAAQVQVGATVYRARCSRCDQPLGVRAVEPVDAVVVAGTCTVELAIEPCAECGERERRYGMRIHDEDTKLHGLPLTPPLYCAECGSLLGVTHEGFKAEPSDKVRVLPCKRCVEKCVNAVLEAISDRMRELTESVRAMRAKLDALPATVPLPLPPYYIPPRWPPAPSPNVPGYPVITWTTQPNTDGTAPGAAQP